MHPRIALLLATSAVILTATPCAFADEYEDDNIRTMPKAQWMLELDVDPIDDKVSGGELKLGHQYMHQRPSWATRIFNVPPERDQHFLFQCFRSNPDAMRLFFHRSHCGTSGKQQTVDVLLRFDNQKPLELKGVFKSGGLLNNRCNLIVPFFSAKSNDPERGYENESGLANRSLYPAVVRGFRDARERVAVRAFLNDQQFTVAMPISAHPTIAHDFDLLHRACNTNLPTNADPRPASSMPGANATEKPASNP